MISSGKQPLPVSARNKCRYARVLMEQRCALPLADAVRGRAALTFNCGKLFEIEKPQWCRA